jgi:hypothetical protein
VEKEISLDFDKGGNTSRLKAVTENFSDQEVSRSGIRAMNFAMGFFYPGDVLKASPDPIMLSFWVLTKKPRFGEAHDLRAVLNGETLNLGDSRYVSKPKEDMEYLNFQLSRADLAKIASVRNAKLQIGRSEFSLTNEQRAVIDAVLKVSEVGR